MSYVAISFINKMLNGRGFLYQQQLSSAYHFVAIIVHLGALRFDMVVLASYI